MDDLSAYDTSASQSDNQQRKFLFTVKIVLAEGLAREGSSSLPDAFVTVSDEHGRRYAKTRTVYDDSNPRWDESFDIPVQHRSWFMVTVRHRNMIGKHDLLGRAYLQLDPSQFSGVMTRDSRLTLDPKGHILLKVGMEGEEDDMQFHFGRAFRCLKRTESDMIHNLVDKVSLFLLSPKGFAMGTGTNFYPLDEPRLTTYSLTFRHKVSLKRARQLSTCI